VSMEISSWFEFWCVCVCPIGLVISTSSTRRFNLYLPFFRSFFRFSFSLGSVQLSVNFRTLELNFFDGYKKGKKFGIGECRNVRESRESSPKQR